MASRDQGDRPFEIFKSWFAERSFWREVTTRTLSALIVAFLVYTVGVASGYIGTQQVFRTLAVLCGIILLALIVRVIITLLSGTSLSGRLVSVALLLAIPFAILFLLALNNAAP